MRGAVTHRARAGHLVHLRRVRPAVREVPVLPAPEQHCVRMPALRVEREVVLILDPVQLKAVRALGTEHAVRLVLERNDEERESAGDDSSLVEAGPCQTACGVIRPDIGAARIRIGATAVVEFRAELRVLARALGTLDRHPVVASALPRGGG